MINDAEKGAQLVAPPRRVADELDQFSVRAVICGGKIGRKTILPTPKARK
jgi:hypothetical protein